MKSSQFANREYTDAQARALSMLRERPDRDIYEGADTGGRLGSGEFYVTYGPGPVLNKLEVENLLNRGLIRHKWADKPEIQMYSLAPTASCSHE
jgi:hypothetical protein